MMALRTNQLRGYGMAGKSRQSGAALLIAVILVLVSTLLGISVMENSDMELRLINNDRFREVAFRAAEGASDQMLTSANIETLINGGAGTITSSVSVDPAVTTSSELTLEAIGIGRGVSLGEGVGGLAPYKITSQSTVTMDGVDASSSVIQGAERYAPKID